MLFRLMVVEAGVSLCELSACESSWVLDYPTCLSETNFISTSSRWKGIVITVSSSGWMVLLR
jgi:hypothetical protein